MENTAHKSSKEKLVSQGRLVAFGAFSSEKDSNRANLVQEVNREEEYEDSVTANVSDRGQEEETQVGVRLEKRSLGGRRTKLARISCL